MLCSFLMVLGMLQDPAFDPATLKPFSEAAPYLDRYETGLYPGGKTSIPVALALVLGYSTN